MLVFFYFFSFLLLAGALSVLLQKNPVSSAISLMVVFFSLSGLYALLDAHLLAALQLLVYAGGVVILFLFVIFLLQADRPFSDWRSLDRWSLLRAGFLSGFFLVLIEFGIRRSSAFKVCGKASPEALEKAGGNTWVLSETLFSEAILPFELTSVLLLIAMIGALILAKRKI